MKKCPKCKNLSDDNAAACALCGSVLDESLIARAAAAPRQRIPTMTEYVEPVRPVSQSRMDIRPTPPPPVTQTSGQPPSRRVQTILVPTIGQEVSGTPSRRILAILVTYTWKPEGQVFPVREGRNLIGRGPECDIQLPEDAMLSQVNSHITYRQTFTLGDMVSMGGTYLNGEPVEVQFLPLDNLGLIRAGSTQFLFVVVDPRILGVVS